MNIASVSYYESGLRTVTVRCSDCNIAHALPWPYGTDVVTGQLPCGPTVSIAVPTWARNPRRDRKWYRFNPAAPHATSEPQSRNDNAIHEYEPNWTE
jgi:hypothetical protein